MPPKACRPPIVIDRVLPDPSLVRTLVERGSPYWSVQRYLRNMAEMASLSDAGKRGDVMFVAPWFRGDWAFTKPLVPGLEPIFAHEGFIEAARALFDGDVVVPQQVYVNLNPPMPQVDPGHVDVPAFRGVERDTTPVWLLAIMLKSGLFDRWYLPMATAVAWYYEGPGGGFRYWPDGPDASPVDRPCISNSAVVGDNDRMFHCVHAVGEKPALPKGLTLDSKLHVENGVATIREGDRELASYPFESVRISISWKALVFPDARAHAVYRDHEDDLTHADVERIFLEDLARRGLPATPPSDLFGDTAFVNRLNAAYGYSPTKFV